MVIYTLAVTKDGKIWIFGRGEDDALCHKDCNDRLVPTRIETRHFCNSNIVSATAGSDLALCSVDRHSRPLHLG